MIDQQELDEIVYQELKAFNLSIGWIDDAIEDCDDWEKVVKNNEKPDYFEISDLMITRIKGEGCLEVMSLNHYESVVIFVEEREPYEDWVNFSHEFRIPSLMCLANTESFTKAFKEAVVLRHKEIKLERIRRKLSYVKSLSDDELLLMDSAKSVCIKFDMKYGEDVVIGIDN